MNLFFTSLWIALFTLASFLLGKSFFPEHVVLVTLIGFVLSIVIRFLPKILGEVVECIVDALT